MLDLVVCYCLEPILITNWKEKFKFFGGNYMIFQKKVVDKSLKKIPKVEKKNFEKFKK